jgi:uncharacterized membrane protein
LIVRFFAYGLLGWCAEIVWTALYEAVTGTRRSDVDPSRREPLQAGQRWALTGKTYLWVLPLYGGAALFLFEPLHRLVQAQPWVLRGLAYMAAVFLVEGGSGLLLRRVIGRCPWDYSYARANVGGVIRLDYAPIWFGFGLALERIHDVVKSLEGPLRATLLRGG